VENEENRCPVPDPKKTMINVTKETSDAHNFFLKTLKEEIFEEIIEKFIQKKLDIVNQNVQDVLKKFEDTKNKEHEKTWKQISELREDFNKHQSEINNTISRKTGIKDDNTKYKRVEQRYGKPQKKESNRNPGNKHFL
jgi:hypothetical protein